VVDGSQSLSTKNWASFAEAERMGYLTIAKAAKGSAPARTRQIKIANPVDRESKGYRTQHISEFLRPIQSITTVLDQTSIARVDMLVVSDKRDVNATTINQYVHETHDPDLEILQESMKLVWGNSLDVKFTEEAERYILKESTRLYSKFYSKNIPLVDHNFKWKLARLSISLAFLTLSTDPEFTEAVITKEHVTEVVRFIESEYTRSGLAAQAKAEHYSYLDPEETPLIIAEIAEAMNRDPEEAVRLCKWLNDSGGAVKDQIKEEFGLAENNELRPLLATLQNLKLVKRSRGFTPTKKLIQIYKVLEKDGQRVIDGAYLVFDGDKRDEGDSQTKLSRLSGLSSIEKGLPKEKNGVSPVPQERLEECLAAIVGGCETVDQISKRLGISMEGVVGLLRVLQRDKLVFEYKPGHWKRA